MRAVRASGGRVQVVSVEAPEPDSASVVIDVAAVGICGSDLHLVSRTAVTLGHEIGGWLDGRPVAVCPIEYCGTCANCVGGHTAVCQTGAANVIGIHRNGGMADQVMVPASCVVELPTAIDARLACLVEPVAVGVHAMNAVTPTPGSRVAVVGGGTVGLVAAALMLDAGHTVDVVARHEHQQRSAEAVGAGLNVKGRYDVVIDAAGTESSLRDAVQRCRTGGNLVIAGTYWDDVMFPGLMAQLKELTLTPVVYYGHHGGRREIEIAADTLAALPSLADVLVTHTMPLDQAPDAFATSANRSTGSIKVVLAP